VDAVNGYVAAESRATDLDAPVNAVLADLLWTWEVGCGLRES
jgi:ketopantoate reductase